MLQRVVSLPKPRSYNTCNALVLNYLSFVFCSYITLWIHFKFMMFAAKSTFPLYTYRSIVFSPIYIYTFNLFLLNSLLAVHSKHIEEELPYLTSVLIKEILPSTWVSWHLHPILTYPQT